MNLKVILHMAKILSLSSVRARREKGSVPKGLAKSPIMNIIFLVIGFPVVAFLAYNFSSIFLEEMGPNVFFLQSSIFLPSFMAFAAIMYGVLFEFSQASYIGSTDIINWLPIRAIEYVFASTLSMTYFLAPVLALFFGATFGIALSINMLNVWLLSSTLGIVGMFLGAFSLEILRAFTNRMSAAFYKRSGRSTVAIRMLVTIILMVTFILIFNINVLMMILQHFVGGISNAWFIPILWPSLAIVAYLGADAIQTVIYTLLSAGFALTLLWMSVKARARYWVPIPVSIKLASSKPYMPKNRILGRFGFATAQTALIRKDLRGLTRRKEMITWIAMPVAMGLISIIALQSFWANATTTIDKLTFFAGPLFGIVMLGFYLALIGVGQEGSAFINLLASPLKEKEIAKAKLTTAFLPAIFALAVLLVFIQILVQPKLEVLIAVTVGLFAVVIESTLVGLAVGTHFPDFTEVPRARFVTQTGVFLGITTIFVSAGATLLPLFLYGLHILESFPLNVATALTAFITIAICYASYRATISNIQKLVNQAS